MAKSRRLFLSTVPEDFDIAQDIAFGPWCFYGQEGKFPGWEELKYIEPFTTQKQVSEAANLCQVWANYLITPLSAKLNKEQGLNFPKSSWRLLLMPWLSTLIYSAYDRYARLSIAIEKLGMLPLIVGLTQEESAWSFKDTTDFIYSGVWILHSIIG